MSTTIISLQYPILFILDPTNKDIVVPPCNNGELIAATTTCVSVGTQASVDGETEVSLDLNQDTCSHLNQVFRGGIVSTGGKVAIVTSDFERLLEKNVPTGIVDVSVFVDDFHSPSQVLVNLHL